MNLPPASVARVVLAIPDANNSMARPRFFVRKTPSLLAVLILILLWLVAVYGTLTGFEYFQQQQVVRSQQQHQQTLNQQVEQIAALTSRWQQRAQDSQQLENWAAVQAFCTLETVPTQPVFDQCLPISFATLASLRQAAQQGQADLAWIQAESAQPPYILMVSQLATDELMMVGLKPEVINELTSTLDPAAGTWHIQQGQNRTIQRVESARAGLASQSAQIPGTHWQLVLNGAVQFMPQWYALVAIPVALLLSLLWWALLKEQASHRPKLNYKSKLLKTAPEMIDSFEPRRLPAWDQPGKNDAFTAADAFDGAAEPMIFQDELSLDLPQTEQTAAAAPLLTIDPAIFKAYDIRGLVDDQLTPAVATVIGQAIANIAMEKNIRQLVVGRDGRLSSAALSAALIEGLTQGGLDVVDVGQVPTPVLYFACEFFKTQSGIMVTGSHNPVNYNGFKIVLDGSVFSGEALQSLYAHLYEKRLQLKQGTVSTRDVMDEYLKAVVKDIRLDRQISVVVDCGNGVAGAVIPQLLRLLGCEVTELFCDVDGRFPNHHPNPGDPENLRQLAETVQAQNAELGLAFDGDGDRLGVVDGHGEIVWPDRLLVLFAQSVLQQQPGARVIFDVKSTGILSNRILQAGGKPTMSASGHSVIRHTLQRTGAKLAGEMSGHIFFADRWFGFDDGLYAACRLLELIANDPQQRDATAVLASVPARPSTPEMLIEMADETAREFVQAFIEQADFDNSQLTLIDGIRVDFATGWGLIRASNTVPALSMRFEAATESDLEQIKQLFKDKILKIKPSLRLPF